MGPFVQLGSISFNSIFWHKISDSHSCFLKTDLPNTVEVIGLDHLSSIQKDPYLQGNDGVRRELIRQTYQLEALSCYSFKV